MTPSWGMFNGYELYENQPASPTSEEYLHSEKYEIKHRDWRGADTLLPLIARVNGIRRRHPALQRLRSIRFHDTDNPQVIAYSKVSDDGDDIMLMVVCLDPYTSQEATLQLDLDLLGLPTDHPFEVFDELGGEAFTWSGPNPYVKLEPPGRVAHILSLPGALR
jgi:starch synthase (maltosyl-transferring)